MCHVDGSNKVFRFLEGLGVFHLPLAQSELNDEQHLDGCDTAIQRQMVGLFR